MGRLFGTDGARGLANIDLSCELVMKIGRATALILSRDKIRPKVLIGMDTRNSSELLVSSISAGLCSAGADVILVGVVPTPAVAYLVRKYRCDAGIMISASHNPFEYNGIKIFKSDGYKLSDEAEEEIEGIILDDTEAFQPVTGVDIGRIKHCEHAIEDYISFLHTTVDCDFKGMHIAIDCANGSSSVSAGDLFKGLGAECHLLYADPDGININHNCGSTHLENLSDYVRSHPECIIGLAFDGDADRLLCVDENGNVVDGDRILSICSDFMKKEGRLKNNTTVVTVMSNMGFFRFCKEKDINFETTKVGDRYVLENMLKNGFNLGGEQSGHIIFLDYATTGDGQLTALQLLRIMKKTGKSLSALAADMTIYPQITKNVTVSQMGKVRFATDESIKIAIKEAEKDLGDNGRIIVRVSGTEPLVRVMVEGKDSVLIEKLAYEVAEVVKERLM